jgi:hypothetical protein
VGKNSFRAGEKCRQFSLTAVGQPEVLERRMVSLQLSVLARWQANLQGVTATGALRSEVTLNGQQFLCF